MKSTLIRVWLLLVLFSSSTHADETSGRFLRLWWYEPGIENGNPVTNRRFRVNAPEAVLHPQFSKRSETKSSGMLQIFMKEDLLQLQGAELSLELWGGHPGTANRRVTLNGRTTYPLPNPVGEHCTHAYPVIQLKTTDLVEGHNAVQFACDQGSTFWGHFIVEQACLNAQLPLDHADLKQAGLNGFRAAIEATPAGEESIELMLKLPAGFAEKIAAVDFQGRYDFFDENGDGQTLDWHGFTKARNPVAHLGTSSEAPFDLKWDLSLLPAQNDMAVRAVVRFQNHPELVYITPPLAGLTTPARQSMVVKILAPTELPAPFWSRANRLKTCQIPCDIDPTRIERAELHAVVWDGGAGTVDKYFTLNGHPLAVAGTGRHDVIYSRVNVDPAWLKRGANQIELLSDTEHHGIEVLLPGPALVLRAKR